MTHPLTPREKVARLIWERFAPSCDMDEANAMRGEYSEATDAILTALASGSGDHAELARDLRAFEGSDDLGNGDFTVCEFAADVMETLLAENAALRAERDGMVEEVSRSQARLHAATEAERKLTDPVELIARLEIYANRLKDAATIMMLVKVAVTLRAQAEALKIATEALGKISEARK